MKHSILNQSWTRIFLAPDADPSGGGSGTSGGQQQQQQSSQQQQVDDPFAVIDLDDLDPDTRKAVEGLKNQFASLQTEKANFQKTAEEAVKQSRAHQSRFDQVQQQLNQLTGGVQVSAEARAKADKLDQLTKEFTSKGVPEANAKVQAEMMYNILMSEREQIKKEMGQELAPFATLQLNREAEWAFTQVGQNDSTGLFQDQELAGEVWKLVQQGAQNGQHITPEIVSNLAGMVYWKAIQEGKIQQQQQQQQTQFTPPMPTFPTLGRPGGPPGFAPQPRQMADPRAPRTGQPTEATAAALRIVAGEWGEKAASKLNGTKK